jgi:hypothetical protein
MSSRILNSILIYICNSAAIEIITQLSFILISHISPEEIWPKCAMGIYPEVAVILTAMNYVYRYTSF